jgi:hypothetical protein
MGANLLSYSSCPAGRVCGPIDPRGRGKAAPASDVDLSHREHTNLGIRAVRKVATRNQPSDQKWEGATYDKKKKFQLKDREV